MESRKVKEIVLSRVHVNVKLEDLQANGKLFADEEAMDLIKAFDLKHTELLKNPPWGQKGIYRNNEEKKQFGFRISKRELNSKFSVIKFDQHYFAIYRGVKQKCHLGEGGFGYAKIVQNIQTGEWAVIKLGKPEYNKNNEFEVLQKIGMAYGQIERIAGNGSHYIRNQGNWAKLMNQNNLVMQYVSGVSLDTYRDEQRERNDQHWLHVCMRVIEAYQKLHDAKIIHGDISLKNIHYDEVDDFASFIDYGNARLKTALWNPNGKLIITPGYTAPELDPYKNPRLLEKIKKKHDAKVTYSYETDIYALGKTLQFFLTSEGGPAGEKLQDIMLRTRVLNYINDNMCNYKASERRNLKDVLQFFRDKLSDAANLMPDSVKKIALISLDEYRSLAVAGHHVEVPAAQVVSQVDNVGTVWSWLKPLGELVGIKAAAQPEPLTEQEPHHAAAVRALGGFIEKLKLFDQVWLVDSQVHNELTYITLRRELEEQGVRVGNRCFVTDASPSQLLPVLLNHIDYANYSKSNKLYYVTTQPDVVKADVSVEDRICVIPALSEYSNEVLKDTINKFAEADIKVEFLRLTENLRMLASKHQEGSSACVLIHDCLNAMTKKYEAGHLSCDDVSNSLKKLHEDLAKAAPTRSRARLEVPVASNSFFGKKSTERSGGINDVEAVEQQFDSWRNSYV